MADILLTAARLPLPASDAVFVDTSVLLSVGAFYDQARQPLYARYLKHCRQNGKRLVVSSLSLVEAAHAIERIHLDRTRKAKGNPALHVKAFRASHPAERAKACGDFGVLVRTVKSWAEVHDATITYPTIESAENLLHAHPIDGYDAFLLLTMRGIGIDTIITDDADYHSVDWVNIISGNRRAVR